MSLDQRITVTCDHPGGCGALRVSRGGDETAAGWRLRGVSDGWDYREGDDYCPEHRKDARP